jgi:hypothetical protein
MAMSAIGSVEQAFRVLATGPGSLVFDARGMAGLPDRLMTVLELRDLLTGGSVRGEALDEVWRRLAVWTRQERPAWTVAAVGIAVPGLKRIVAGAVADRCHLVEDIESEAVAGFLHALRHDDLKAANVWLRMMWSVWRCVDRVRCAPEEALASGEAAAVSRIPRAPYGHPDLLLYRAVVAGILTAKEADLIGDTRLGQVLVEQVADAEGVTAQVMRMRRNRAEHRLVAALRNGDLSDTVRPGRHLRASAPARTSATSGRSRAGEPPSPQRENVCRAENVRRKI